MKKILLILIILLIPVFAFAEGDGTYETGPINQIDETTISQENNSSDPVVDNTITQYTDDIIDQNVTIEDAGNKVLNKLYEVADLLKRIAAPISIITFIIGALLMVVGALGKKDGAKPGLVVCVLSVIMYAICMYSEQIIIAISNWVVS